MRAKSSITNGVHAPERLCWLGLVCCTLISGCGIGSDADSQRADIQQPAPLLAEQLETWRFWYKLPAAAAVIVQNQQVTEFAVVGNRTNDAAVPVASGDKFLLNSNTKAMTATMLAVLVERGVMTWDTRLGDVFHELCEEMDPAFADVTLTQLLIHRAGLPTDRVADGTLQRIASQDRTLTEKRLALLRKVTSRPPATPPGSQFVYANAGYCIAAAMAERITGETYEELMQALLFEPLDMSSAGFGTPGHSHAVDQPRGHAMIGGRLKPIDPGPHSGNPAFVAPSGGVHVSLMDWAKFDLCHLDGARGREGVLAADTLKHLQTPPTADYAFGWYVREDSELGTILSHGGTDRLWYSVNYVLPEQDLAVLVATNCAHDAAQRGVRKIVTKLVRQVVSGSPPQ